MGSTKQRSLQPASVEKTKMKKCKQGSHFSDRAPAEEQRKASTFFLTTLFILFESGSHYIE